MVVTLQHEPGILWDRYHGAFCPAAIDGLLDDRLSSLDCCRKGSGSPFGRSPRAEEVRYDSTHALRAAAIDSAANGMGLMKVLLS